jgi:hypothetical protein
MVSNQAEHCDLDFLVYHVALGALELVHQAQSHPLQSNRLVIMPFDMDVGSS